MYERIMVPLDGSTFSEQAMPLATMLARSTGADLHVVLAIDPIAAPADSEWEIATQAWAHAYLQNVQEELSRDGRVGVTTALLQGDPTEGVLAEARAIDASLTVMATHGRGAISRMWIGSVADAFSRRHDGPVLLVRPRAPENAPPPSGRGDILVPLDGSELSEEALAHAVELGETIDSTFHLTRVVATPPTFVSPYLPDTAAANDQVLRDAREGAARYLEEHATRLRRRGFRVTTSVEVDDQAARAILAEVQAVGADFVVMATHGYEGLRRTILGSTADKVLRGSSVPLLLFRPTRPGLVTRAVS